ncbi:hypothetical protein ATO12_17730 [Aquimarina atlantica]|uniref:Uncharacterized protein n=1 Tax=Aquimarina atlantica TaxID=1317122 RepID=A0A023BUX0_9FLAO|nr:hypothetical protein [Aquimarina atlantica]EZH73775.1 hypothetical protein ATO12_17730 [Aquimarina atlantica]
MIFKKKFLISVLTICSLIVQAQEGVWINEYAINPQTNKKSNEFSNRLMFKIEKDSIFPFDSGKEEWKGTFNNGYRYLKDKNKLSIPSIGIKLEYPNKDRIILRNKNEVLYFRKVEPKKIALKKLKKLILKNIFISDLGYQKKDTISFYENSNLPQYSFNNIEVRFMKLDNMSLLLANFKGAGVYEINDVRKNYFSLNINSKKGIKEIEFYGITLNNINTFIIKKEALMIEK